MVMHDNVLDASLDIKCRGGLGHTLINYNYGAFDSNR